MIKLKSKLLKEYREFQILLRSVPTSVLVFYTMVVFSMNLLANKSISFPYDVFALDCGITVSWFVFLTMDILTVHFGPKAATQISVFAIVLNLIFCLLFGLIAKIPGSWGQAVLSAEHSTVNSALDNTFGGSVFVIFGSTIAFITSSFVNNFSNYVVGKAFAKNPGSFFAYISRTYISTAIGQFIDNMTFALIVSRSLFGWTLEQCAVCALFGMLAELLCEIAFSAFGFKICVHWKKKGVGCEYIDYRTNNGGKFI